MTEQQKLLNYAKEFKKGAKRSKNLLNSVKTQILPDMNRKREQFYVDVKDANEKRFDSEMCMRRFVKLTMDRKVIY